MKNEMMTKNYLENKKDYVGKPGASEESEECEWLKNTWESQPAFWEKMNMTKMQKWIDYAKKNMRPRQIKKTKKIVW